MGESAILCAEGLKSRFPSYGRVGEDSMSSKQEKAMVLKDAGQDIEVMSEEQFLTMLGVEL